MSEKLPILILIPHGGYGIPEELSAVTEINERDAFLEADTCANELFAFDNRVPGCLTAETSRLFIDLDRSHLDVSPRNGDGLIKRETPSGKEVFPAGAFPDHIAIANLVRRYHAPFHDTIRKILAAGGIKLILECHTMMPVGPRNAADPGMPRPLVSIDYTVEYEGAHVLTAEEGLARGLAESLKKFLASEDATVTEKLLYNRPVFGGFIMAAYGAGSVPLLRLSVSRSLFLNDKYFNYDFLKVDELRISHLRDQLWDAIRRFYLKYIG